MLLTAAAGASVPGVTFGDLPARADLGKFLNVSGLRVLICKTETRVPIRYFDIER